MIHDELEQSHLINEFHNLPRFGHGNAIVALVSHNRSEQEDYIRGMLSFCCFLVLSFYIWWFVLVALKVVFPHLVGCAAGGHTLDVAKLRKAKIRRDIRRRWIVRAWRLQWAFLFVSILIPVTTLLLTRNGLSPFIHSLDEIKGVADEVESVSFRGIEIAKALQSARKDLARVNTTAARQHLHSDLSINCSTTTQPLHNASLLALPPIATVSNYIEAGVDEVKAFIDYYAIDAHIGLGRVVEVSEKVNSSIEWIYDNDWAIKFFLLTINIVNAFFLFGVFLSHQDIVSYKYQQFLSLQIIPIFTLLLVCSSIITCAFGMATMLNADFCHGNANVNGTMSEIFAQSGVAESDLSYRAFLHYMEGCLGESPMSFIHEVNSVISYTIDAANLLGEPTMIRDVQCAKEASVLISQMNNVTSALNDIQRQVSAVIDLTGCHRINPVLRRIIHGSTCSETVSSLAWLFGGFCFITILGFVMLSVRAALYNSVIRAPRRKRHREREKEFDEYKAYMAEFYADTDNWELELYNKKMSDPEREIVVIPTFDTEEASESRRDDDDDDDQASEAACFESPKAASKHSSSASSASSSYESDYSEDSEEQKSIMSLSVLGKLFHINRNEDDNQSFLAGISMLGFDTPSNASHARSQIGVLDLQTPRRRRPASSLGLYCRSPNSEASSSMASPSSLGRPPSSLGLSCRSPKSAASPVAGSNLTPTAPSKPNRFVHRTRASRKDA